MIKLVKLDDQTAVDPDAVIAVWEVPMWEVPLRDAVPPRDGEGAPIKTGVKIILSRAQARGWPEPEHMLIPNMTLDEVLEKLYPPVETDDSLHRWLHWRYGKQMGDWSTLDQYDREFWRHEADAVRRAVARGGFKKGDDHGQEE